MTTDFDHLGRQADSLQEALRLYPFADNRLVPDIAFWCGIDKWLKIDQWSKIDHWSDTSRPCGCTPSRATVWSPTSSPGAGRTRSYWVGKPAVLVLPKKV